MPSEEPNRKSWFELMSCLSVQTRISIRVLAFLVISPATAADFAETARKAQAAYAAAQREWQIGLAELAVEQRPEFEAIAKAQRDLQVAYLERGTSKFEYLMAEDHPSRIVLTEGLSQFINYDWSDEDTQTLREADPGYAALDVKVAALRKSNDDQRDWGSFREYFRNTLLKSKEYQALYSAFMEKQKAVEALLDAYKRKTGPEKPLTAFSGSGGFTRPHRHSPSVDPDGEPGRHAASCEIVLAALAVAPRFALGLEEKDDRREVAGVDGFHEFRFNVVDRPFAGLPQHVFEGRVALHVTVDGLGVAA